MADDDDGDANADADADAAVVAVSTVTASYEAVTSADSCLRPELPPEL